MRILLFIFTFTFILTVKCFGQEFTIDSIIKVISSQPDDTSKVRTLALLSLKLSSTKPLEAFAYAKQVVELSRKLKFTEGEALGYNRIGLSYERQTAYDSAFHYYFTSNEIYTALHNDYGQANTFRSLGILHGKRAAYDSSAIYFFKSLKIGEVIHDKHLQASNFNNISLLMKLDDKLDEAITYGINALSLLEQIGNKQSSASTSNNLGSYFLLKKDFPSAEKYFGKALTIFNELSDKRGIGGVHENIASFFHEQNKLDSALAHGFIALNFNKEMNDQRETAKTMQEIAEIYFDMNNYVKAEEYSKQALDIALQTKELKIQLDNYKLLHRINNKKADFKTAYEYLLQSQQLGDSVFNVKKTSTINNLKTKYETEKKENEIKFLKKDKEIRDLEMQKQHVELAHQQLLAQQKSQQLHLITNEKEIQQLELVKTSTRIQNQQIELEKKKQENKLLAKESQLHAAEVNRQKIMRNSFLGGAFLFVIIGLLLFNRYRISQEHKQQVERLRISSDLHDEVGSTLSSIGMISNYAATQLSENKQAEAEKLLTEVAASAMQMGDDMNDIIWAINPHNDTFENIINRLRNFASRTAESKRIQLHFDVDGGLLKENISMEKRKNLYLICKEAINNAVKYSSCKNLTLSFNKNKNLLVVTIIDDGKGFDLENHVDGNGIKNIKQRSGQIGCKLKLISNSKEGTMLILECPLS